MTIFFILFIASCMKFNHANENHTVKTKDIRENVTAATLPAFTWENVTASTGNHTAVANVSTEADAEIQEQLKASKEEIVKMSNDCKETRLGKEYRGTVRTTKSGRTCQAWASQQPNSHSQTTPKNYPYSGLTSNYCRNPDFSPNGPWCYTIDGGRWDNCDIKMCSGLIVEHEGEECLKNRCGKGGWCHWCGQGACCRKEWNNGNGCDGSNGCAGGHCCSLPTGLILVEHEGEECWNNRCRKGGWCDWCGQGACCRKGWNDGNGCDGSNGCAGHHCCSLQAAGGTAGGDQETSGDSEDWDLETLKTCDHCSDHCDHCFQVLHLQTGNNYGKWGKLEMCIPGSFVKYTDIQVEKPTYKDPLFANDDTGLNSIRMICQTVNGRITNTITSSEGFWGEWRDNKQCPSGFVTAVRMKSMPWKPYNDKSLSDNKGATNLQINCGSGDSEYKFDSWDVKDDVGYWGEWGEWVHCESGKAVCGLVTRVQSKQGGFNDDSAMTDLKLICCTI